MGTLRRLDSALDVELAANSLAGRGSCYVVELADPGSSAPHASLRWSGTAWEVHDLDSLNGTRVDGRLLAPGERASLVSGARLRFGAHEDFEMVHAGPPRAFARRVGGGVCRVAQGGMLTLSDEDAQPVSIYQDAAGAWVLERDDDIQQLLDREVVRFEDHVWRVRLPTATHGTWDGNPGEPTLELVRLRFRVSLDEEHVELSIYWGGTNKVLRGRSFHYLLLTLARQRLDDLELPPKERGWIHRDDLCRMLAVAPLRLNVDIYRARKQLIDLGIEGAGRLIERRATTHEVRLGIERVVVEPL